MARLVAASATAFVTFVLFGLITTVSGLEITHFEVPAFVDLKDEATLECVFALTDPESLYSVKWYRTTPQAPSAMEEFYSYKPGRSHPAKHYKLRGIRVEMRESNVNRVSLRKVSLDTTGVYRCEVTSKTGPGRFDAKVKEARLEVLALPESSPVITGGLNHYRLGDRLQLNCTSAKTFPPTRLMWLLNGRTVDQEHLYEYPTRMGMKSGLFRSRLGLDMPIRDSLFHKGKIRLECTGEVEDGVLQGWSEGSSRHLIQTVRLPEALKREVTQVFVVPMTSGVGRAAKVCWWMVAATAAFLTVIH